MTHLLPLAMDRSLAPSLSGGTSQPAVAGAAFASLLAAPADGVPAAAVAGGQPLPSMTGLRSWPPMLGGALDYAAATDTALAAAWQAPGSRQTNTTMPADPVATEATAQILPSTVVAVDADPDIVGDIAPPARPQREPALDGAVPAFNQFGSRDELPLSAAGVALGTHGQSRAADWREPVSEIRGTAPTEEAPRTEKPDATLVLGSEPCSASMATDPSGFAKGMRLPESPIASTDSASAAAGVIPAAMAGPVAPTLRLAGSTQLHQAPSQPKPAGIALDAPAAGALAAPPSGVADTSVPQPTQVLRNAISAAPATPAGQLSTGVPLPEAASSIGSREPANLDDTPGAAPSVPAAPALATAPATGAVAGTLARPVPFRGMNATPSGRSAPDSPISDKAGDTILPQETVVPHATIIAAPVAPSAPAPASTPGLVVARESANGNVPHAAPTPSGTIIAEAVAPAALAPAAEAARVATNSMRSPKPLAPREMTRADPTAPIVIDRAAAPAPEPMDAIALQEPPTAPDPSAGTSDPNMPPVADGFAPQGPLSHQNTAPSDISPAVTTTHPATEATRSADPQQIGAAAVDPALANRIDASIGSVADASAERMLTPEPRTTVAQPRGTDAAAAPNPPGSPLGVEEAPERAAPNAQAISDPLMPRAELAKAPPVTAPALVAGPEPVASVLIAPMQTVAAQPSQTQASVVPAAPAAYAPPEAISARPGEIGQQLGVEIARHSQDGHDNLVIRLDPVELGKIQIRIQFDEQGSLRAQVTAESPAALEMLRRDSSDLARALNDAGVRTDAQSFQFDARGQSREQPGQRQQPQGNTRHDDLSHEAEVIDQTQQRRSSTAGSLDLFA